MKKDLSIEYAHIYTNKKIGDEQKLSLEILNNLTRENTDKNMSLVVMVDDYSFPDPSFDYKSFLSWLSEEGFKPDLVIRESQLIPSCDEVLSHVTDKKLKDQISDYVRGKKYPCSIFVATWYLVRLGYINSPIFNKEFVAKKVVNILPLSFKSFEDKAIDIIKATKFGGAVNQIENKYFEGRSLEPTIL
ncbi:MAG: hypothetical protein Q8R55_01595 [Candidatus Taylorbacteria bacterium]|nr:hypothetical protein [Candidatus Taylorbacteria bacterium]